MSQFDNRGPPSKRGRMDNRGPQSSGGGRMLSEQEIDHELSRVNPEMRPNKVLLLTVLNAEYPIDVPVISKVCQAIGGIQRIVVFRRGQIIHAMVEFESIEQSSKAKRNLHGCDIYSGCCTLKVEFSKVERLDVRKNDDLTWDFTQPDLSESKQPRMDRPVLLQEPPQENINAGFNNMDGGGGMRGGMGGMDRGMGGGMMDRGMGGGMRGGMDGGMGGGGMSGGMGGGMMGGGMGGGMRGGMGMSRGGMGPGPSRIGGNGGMGEFGGPFNSMSSMMGAINGGMGGGRGMHGGDDFGPGARGGMMQGRFQPGPQQGAVCIIYGVDAEHFNCQKIFNLFCQYGNIRKIMFLKSKEGTAMMEMDEPGQVQNILDNMMQVEMFGLKIRVDWSKKDCLTHVTNPYKLADGTESYMSFEGERNNRFSTPERAAKNRILPPSKHLHVYNVPKLSSNEMEDVFSDAGAPTPTKVSWLNHGEGKFVSGILEFASVSDALEALCLLNHHAFVGETKYPQIMKLCFSMGKREDRDDAGGHSGRGGGGRGRGARRY